MMATKFDKDELQALWDSYHTHSDSMEKMDPSEQYQAMQQQISGFEKLLQNAMSRFSRERYYSILRTLSEQERSRNPAGRGRIQSMSQLHRIRNNLQHEGSQRSVRKDQDHLAGHVEKIFQDIQYMKNLKKYFDEKIYSCLYQYFYDPCFEANSDDDEGASTSSRSNHDIDYSELTDKQKLGQAISQMQDINTKWDALLADDELDEYMFDSDSYHEIRKFKDFKPFELLLRLFPDLFVKAFKSIEVAKTWWTQATKLSPQEPRIANVKLDFNYKVSAMEHLLTRLEADIQDEEKILESEQLSLDILRQREGRWTTLSDSCNEVEGKKNDVDLKYNHLKLKRQSLVQELQDPHSRDKNKQDLITSKLEQLDKDIRQTNDQLQLLSYQLKILYQDLDVEMTVRPEMIRYLGSLEDKVGASERSLSQKKNSKEESEKQLLVIRRNLRSMKELMISRSNTEYQSFDEKPRNAYIASHVNNQKQNNQYSPEHNAKRIQNSEERERYEDMQARNNDMFNGRSGEKHSQSDTRPWKPKPTYLRRRSKNEREY